MGLRPRDRRAFLIRHHLSLPSLTRWVPPSPPPRGGEGRDLRPHVTSPIWESPHVLPASGRLRGHMDDRLGVRLAGPRRHLRPRHRPHRRADRGPDAPRLFHQRPDRRTDLALEGGRGGDGQCHQPPQGGDLHPLAWRAGAVADGWRSHGEFRRHQARRDLHLPFHGPPGRHLLVPQPFRRPGAGGLLRAHRHRAGERRALQGRARLRGDAERPPSDVARRHPAQAEAGAGLLQRPPAQLARPAARSGRCEDDRATAGHHLRPPDVGRDAHGSDRPGRRHGLYLPGERTRPDRQLDWPVQARRAGAAALHQRLGDDDLRCAHPRPSPQGGAGRRQRRRAGRGRRVQDRGRRDL